MAHIEWLAAVLDWAVAFGIEDQYIDKIDSSERMVTLRPMGWLQYNDKITGYELDEPDVGRTVLTGYLHGIKVKTYLSNVKQKKGS